MEWPADEKIYEGEFFAGKPIGNGIKIGPGGTKQEGYWAGGKFFEGEANVHEL